MDKHSDKEQGDCEHCENPQLRYKGRCATCTKSPPSFSLPAETKSHTDTERIDYLAKVVE